MNILSISKNELDKLDQTSQKIIYSTIKMYKDSARVFNRGALFFWKNPNFTPSEIASKLGTNAVDIFKLHYALGQFLSSIDPESISDGLSVIGEFTMNSDGTVTITEDKIPPSIPQDFNVSLVSEI